METKEEILQELSKITSGEYTWLSPEVKSMFIQQSILKVLLDIREKLYQDK